MATRPTASMRSLALELAGAPAGLLVSATPPSLRVDPGAAHGELRQPSGSVTLGEMAAEFYLAESGPLLDWLRSLLARRVQPAAGALLVLDQRWAVQRRVDFSDGLLTGLSWPVLAAADGKTPFTIGLRWQPGSVVDGQAKGGEVKPGISKRKALLVSNYRVSGLPFDALGLSRIALPTVSSKLVATRARQPMSRYAVIDFGELRLDCAGRSLAPARAWVQKVLADGRLDDADFVDLTIELLDPSLKTVLATLQLKGCGLLGLDEPRLIGQDEQVPALGLRFSVEQMDLQVA